MKLNKELSNPHEDRLYAIFGEQFISNNADIRKRLCQIKSMRFIKLTTDPMALASKFDKILYNDCKRTLNEHAMKLLLKNELPYSRS